MGCVRWRVGPCGTKSVQWNLSIMVYSASPSCANLCIKLPVYSGQKYWGSMVTDIDSFHCIGHTHDCENNGCKQVPTRNEVCSHSISPLGTSGVDHST